MDGRPYQTDRPCLLSFQRVISSFRTQVNPDWQGLMPFPEVDSESCAAGKHLVCFRWYGNGRQSV